MAITLSQYRDAFSEHASVSDDNVESRIDWANSDVSSEFLGNKFERAQLYYAAHFVQSDFVSPSAGTGSPSLGQLTSRTVDKVSATFASPIRSSSAIDFMTTSYGQRYVSMVSMMMGPVSL